ncbi:MAG TPA: nuclear transport factor 2 family protein [Rhodothermales bacterium]|nr:nuclear transport factor 2 family protein [Rhodothermales bacterium]
MSKSVVPTLLICFVLAACGQKADDRPAGGGPPDAAPLLETDRAFAQLSADSGAVAAFSMYLADSAVQMPSGTGPITGRESIVEAMSSGPELQLLWEPKHAEIAISGELGWTWGIYEARFMSGEGEEVSSAGKYLNVWRKQDDGAWKVIVDMGNSGV